VVRRRLRLPRRLAAEVEVAVVAPLEEDVVVRAAAEPRLERRVRPAVVLARPVQLRAAARRNLVALVVAAGVVDRAASGSARIRIRAT